MFKINFRLKAPEEICPWGSGMHWFGLTDSLLWINVGDKVIYEYSEDALKLYGCQRYNDYQLSRFLEDFSELFSSTAVSVPHELYEAAECFFEMSEEWRRSYIDEPDEIFDEFYYNEYAGLTEWYGARTMNSGHLVGGPNISFVRCGDMLKIIWDSIDMLENGGNMWTSPKGIYEMDYGEFAYETKRFFGEFFTAMDGQVRKSCEMDWGDINLDKARLCEENVQRREMFEQRLRTLDDTASEGNYRQILGLFEKMKTEINYN